MGEMYDYDYIAIGSGFSLPVRAPGELTRESLKEDESVLRQLGVGVIPILLPSTAGRASACNRPKAQKVYCSES